MEKTNFIETKEVARITAIVTENLTVYIKAGETPLSTKDAFIKYLEGPAEFRDAYKNVAITHTVEDMLQSIRETYAHPDVNSEFEFKIYDTFFSDCKGEVIRSHINAKNLGIAIYAFIGAQRARDKKEQEKKLAENSKSQYFGTVGQRLTLNLVYDRTVACFDYAIHFFHDENENIFKWSTNNGIHCQPGQSVSITGTIRDHSEYKGIKQTSINRCKIA